ncbi:MAG: glycosyltransferase family 9 protein [Synergistaceae bacterium]|nr:glycosyltransferase family 9 protein [Synergistaceae bacterium]MBQ3693241.1 glycosyltransferase family 9 protein [Synergistaceae bacterium]
MNFLIHTGSGIGDMVQKLPMARAIKEEYPDANIDFLTKGSVSSWNVNKNIIECQHYVRNLYWYNSQSKLHCLKLLFQLILNHYDYGFVRDGGIGHDGIAPSFWIFRIMRWSGCKKIVGYLKEHVDIYAEVPDRAHYLERDRLTLKATGIERDLKTDNIDVTLTDKSILTSLNGTRKIIGLSAGTNAYTFIENGKEIIYDVKSWSYEKWVRLSEELVKHGYDVILLGGVKELNEIHERNINIPENEHIMNFIGRTSLKQSLALLSACSLVIGGEGGMMHCAAGMGIKTLTIMGGSDYLQWRPANGEIINLNYECAPCYATRRAIECGYHKCLENISVSMVLEKILSLKI